VADTTDVPSTLEALPELLEDLTAEFIDEDEPVLRRAGGSKVDTWRENHPFTQRMTRPEYDSVKRLLQIELLKLQYWSPTPVSAW